MENLSSIGVKVKVKLRTTVVVGRVYAYLHDEDLLMLVSDEGDQYTVIRTNKASLEFLDDGVEKPLDLVIPPSLEEVNRLFAPDAGARIYAELGKTYTVGWRGTDICLPDLDLTISSPYKSARDISGDLRSLARMTGVLQKIRTKLGLE